MNKFPRILFMLLFSLVSISSSVQAQDFKVTASVSAPRVYVRSVVLAPGSSQMDNAFQTKEIPFVEHVNPIEKKKIPCVSLQITSTGVICDGQRLDFPEVAIRKVLDGTSFLPEKSKSIFVSKKVVGNITYKNLTLVLRWEAATPEELQVYMNEIFPSWNNRVPYRLLWDAHYESCSGSCSVINDKGEILPADVDGLSSSLAADINYNDVPVAFWDANIKP